jgi:hypothetical protein
MASDTSRYKVNNLRQQYLEASKDIEAARSFNDLMSNYKEQDPVVLAYKAVSEAVMAKYVWNPYSKLKYLRASAHLFDKAVKLNKTHPEIRFLRFTVEHYVPRYLDLSGHITDDKRIIINSLVEYPGSGLPPALARSIRHFMLSKDHCTEQEKATLQALSI